jgi:hypothetical protein
MAALYLGTSHPLAVAIRAALIAGDERLFDAL